MNSVRPALSKADWVRLNRLLEHGLALEGDARAAWVASLDTEPTHLRSVLVKLLDAAEDGGPGSEAPEAIARVASDALAAVQRDQPGQRIGPWRLERMLAEGGMGAVWLAERADGVMARTAALKLPRSEWIDHGLRERIARERSFLARLQHPNIAVLYDAGVTPEGRPYLALEYVQGVPIDAYCRQHVHTVNAVLELFLPVIRAVEYAHSRLVIHRDIKPGNLLITAGGSPKLLDFGVSKLIEGDQATAELTALTRIGGRPLTLSYAAPEQLLDQPATVALDVYSLGVVLFELLTRERLYRSTTPHRLEQEILAGDVRRPSEAAKDKRRAAELRGDLDAILLTALRRSPEERYASAGAFADDLQRLLAGKPVRAQPDSRVYRMRKFLARNRVPAVAIASIMVALGIGAGTATWQAGIAREQATAATALTTFVLSLIKHADPDATLQTRKADLATLAAIEEQIQAFHGTAEQRLRLRVTVGDAYRNRGESAAAQRAYQRAAEDAQGSVSPDNLLLLTAHVRAADPRLITSMTAVARLVDAVDRLRADEQRAPELLVDALLIQHQLANDFGVPQFPPLDERFDLLGAALDVADRRFGKGSREYLRVLLPYVLMLDVSGDRPNARRLLDEGLGEAQKRTDNVLASNDYREAQAAHLSYLCSIGRSDEGLLGLNNALQAVHAAHDETSVQLESVYAALGACHERTWDPSGYWAFDAAFEVAATRERPPSLHAMFRASRALIAYVDLKHVDAAERFYQKAVENLPAFADADLREKMFRRVQMLRVCLLEMQGEPQEAERLARSLIALIDREPNPRMSREEFRMRKCLSFAQRELGRYDDAVNSARALIALCERYLEAGHFQCRNRGMLALAWAYLDAGFPQQTLDVLTERRKLPLQPNINPEVTLAAGRARLGTGDVTGAIGPLQAGYAHWLGSLTPRSVFAAEAEYWLGQAYLANGDRRGRWMVEEARRTLATSPLRSHRALAGAGPVQAAR